MVSLPNLITLGRLLLVPVIISLLLDGRHVLVFTLFLVAGVSDAVDGFVAKRYNSATALGAYLDPLADKALLVSIFVALGILNHLPVWLVILVVSRDILIIGAIVLSFLIGHPVVIAPLRISKANTFLQITLASYVLAFLTFPNLDIPYLDIDTLTLAVAATTILSGGSYLITWYRSVATWENGHEE